MNQVKVRYHVPPGHGTQRFGDTSGRPLSPGHGRRGSFSPKGARHLDSSRCLAPPKSILRTPGDRLISTPKKVRFLGSKYSEFCESDQYLLDTLLGTGLWFDNPYGETDFNRLQVCIEGIVQYNARLGGQALANFPTIFHNSAVSCGYVCIWSLSFALYFYGSPNRSPSKETGIRPNPFFWQLVTAMYEFKVLQFQRLDPQREIIFNLRWEQLHKAHASAFSNVNSKSNPLVEPHTYWLTLCQLQNWLALAGASFGEYQQVYHDFCTQEKERVIEMLTTTTEGAQSKNS